MKRTALLLLALLLAAPAFAADAPAPALNSGDTAWMLTSTLLVILMTIPGLALFYGGLARSKNMLSVLVQVFVIFSLSPCCGPCTATAWPSAARATSSAAWTSCSSRASRPTPSARCPPSPNTCSWPSRAPSRPSPSH
jgi:hypothetical protein